MDPQPGGNTVSNVVCMMGERGNGARFVHTIYQEDLQKVKRLTKAARDARVALEEWESYLREALRCGAKVEPGLLSLDISKVPVSEHVVPAYTATRVIVR